MEISTTRAKTMVMLRNNSEFYNVELWLELKGHPTMPILAYRLLLIIARTGIHPDPERFWKHDDAQQMRYLTILNCRDVLLPHWYLRHM
jgi:hypothetical protein